ncbi:hypothetical protein SY83_20975 [Paenibacillus swuensis]|uniref:DUF3502 domain-containing protein n=1 Tax=Paenibacillus swuensis TaxID=1178515 RepID=A0A172TNM0_9BACL|nr:ABC transporter substrate-binding protein [Paenibacillus swuensis]ANE48343.1 hypothetical protein SY83_20975 [Paenibacillus swuensis]
MKKSSLTLLAVLLTIMIVLTGCSGNSNGNGNENGETKESQNTPSGETAATEDPSKPDISKEVKLKMYLVGDQPKDTSLVYEEINKKLKQDINATVEPVFLSWGEYNQKYPLLFATGEEFDLVYAASWMKYSEQANKGAFLELKPELLNKYAPLTMKEMPEEAWKQAEVNGKVFMVPSSNRDFPMVVGAVRGDLREKYKLAPIKTFADYEKYLDAIANNEPDLVPYDADGKTYQIYDMMLNPDHLWKVMVANSGIAFDVKDPSGKVINYLETPAFMEFAKKASEYNQKGYWSKSVMTNKTTVRDSFLSGRSASMAGNLLEISSAVTSASQSHPDWKVEMFNVYEGKPTYSVPYTGNGMAINANAKNPERALMLLDLFRNNEEYFNLTTYGIEGTHYELTADKKIKALNGSESGYKPDSGSPWGWRTPSMYKVMADAPPEYAQMLESFNKSAITNPLLTFVFDNTKFKNELAAMKNVTDQYRDALYLGALGDPEQGVKTLLEKYKEAGMDKVMAEVQKQVDVFMAAQK